MALAPLGAQVRPYKDYLTPALHQRFTHASGYTLLLCYIIAVWMGELKSVFWMVNPVGYTGLRTLILFIPALTIYVLRVAQWHVGARHTSNPASTVTKYLFRPATILTPAFYCFSSWVFLEAYLWSRAPDSKLGATELGREYERIKLNERPINLRWSFLVLSLAQAGVHLWKDYDKIDVPALKPKTESEDAAAALPTKQSPRPWNVLFRSIPSLALKSMSLAAVAWAVSSALYFPFVRHWLWSFCYSIGRKLWSLSKTSKPTGLAPFAPLVSKIVTEGSLLVLLWEFVNKAFDLYIAQEPLKNVKPITDDSKDPNGTLLNGLKSKKDAVKAIAFWELGLITASFPARRSTIYSETERKKGDTFQQVTSICLSEVKFLIERLSIALDPKYTPASSTTTQPSPPINLIGQISQPIRSDKQVTAAPPQPTSRWDHVEAATSGIAKSYSAPGNAQQAYGRDALNKGIAVAKDGKEQAETLFTSAYNYLITTPIGYFFQHSLQRTLSIVVLGAPYSRVSILCNAITALTNLATFSISHDTLGRYQKCIPDIVTVFTRALALLEEYVEKTRVQFSDTGKVEDVELVRECLRAGLEAVLDKFEPYLAGLGLSGLEIGEARKVVGRREMIEAGR
ncbi:nuclear envelope protein-like protein [Plenodomus tracheiphilus IPT5]|uniref:Nuclear envelope protein-like protein n=1 Tax=Plenodomus tracheiphilus IPT5 TaxID=1408161 RepID=A0A6A7AUH1_9PLEO|nr:nuclear envelope protein-like protein [Plenodomus tracheiphilus IPT5]